jgi:hypothetical protein
MLDIITQVSCSRQIKLDVGVTLFELFPVCEKTVEYIAVSIKTRPSVLQLTVSFKTGLMINHLFF